MPPTTRKTTSTTNGSRKPAARRAAPRATPAPEPEEVDDYPDEAEAQEIEADGHYVTATLDGEDIRIIPPAAWRQSWQRKLNSGDIDAFAEDVIHPDDLDLYFEIDPTNDAFGEFVAAAADKAGESLGKSRGRGRSSRRTRRR